MSALLWVLVCYSFSCMGDYGGLWGSVGGGGWGGG